ncbi:hypothetical protein [Roseicella frigidaeris]|uniref:Lipoprotein n=1 Tax=Roseicella frigidaeris TaxID=2230885 RepID=A0A327MAT5_9PROT|nr:hypothetical protein [Roseicella frigidaeris]RAI59254.1 hypothetical protein DOO78_09485 [Roseicella frigidaeris]
MMRITTLTLGLAAGLALAACSEVKPGGPPIAGTSAGPGAPPLKQDARDIAGSGSPNATPGTATITGTRSTGQGTEPTVDYSGQAGNAGSSTPTPLPTTPRSRSNKGG